MVAVDQIRELRELTKVSITQCKSALEEASGDIDKAKAILRKKGSEIAEKKSDRTLGSGVVEAYIHNTRQMGAIVVLSCETDFVAKNEEFIALARDIAMQIVATAPRYTRIDSVISQDVKKEEILLEQDFIKDPSMTIKNLIDSATQKFGENIVISEFSRYSLK